jgi:hypothetical protein
VFRVISTTKLQVQLFYYTVYLRVSYNYQNKIPGKFILLHYIYVSRIIIITKFQVNLFYYTVYLRDSYNSHDKISGKVLLHSIFTRFV